MQTQESGVSVMLNEITSLNDTEFLMYPKVSIKDMSNEVLGAQLPKVLMKFSVFTGFKGVIDQANKQDITKMILSQYKSLAVVEIDKAFQMERYGSFATKTDHYQLFNAIYISDILNKYLKWKKERRNVLNLKPLEEPKKELPIPLKSTEEWAEEIKTHYLEKKQMPPSWFKFWLTTWEYFHNIPEIMAQYEEPAKLMLQQEYLQLQPFANKAKPTEREIKRKMAELSLIEMWNM